jgi:hypothetical protein
MSVSVAPSMLILTHHYPEVVLQDLSKCLNLLLNYRLECPSREVERTPI